MKWLLGIIIVIIIGLLLWWSGIFSGSTTTSQQSAAAANTVAATNTGSIGVNGTAGGNPAISAVTGLTAQIDPEIQANTSALSSVGSKPSLTVVSGIAARVGSINTQMLSSVTPLQAMIAAANSAGKPVTASQAALADMQRNVSGATSILVSAQKSLAALNPSKAAANTTVLNSVVVQLRSAEEQLQNARADIQTIVTASTH